MAEIESKQLAIQARNLALSIHELNGASWLREARKIAYNLCLLHGSFSVDDIRRVLPMPKGDPRIMGAVPNHKWFEPLDVVNSDRVTCHRRPIRKFGLSLYAKNLEEMRKNKDA